MQELSRETLEAIVRAIPAGVVIIEKPNGKVIYVNDRAKQLYGADPLELTIPDHSTKLFKLLTLEGQIYPPDKLPATVALLTEKRAADDLVIERPDKTKVTVYASAMPVKNEKGEVVAAVGIFEDITERREMQQRLEEYAKSLEDLLEERSNKIVEEEQRYRELYESFDEAFIATDWELNVIHWNKAAERITKVAPEAALGKKVYEVLPEMLTVDITPYFDALQQRKPARFMMNTVSRQTGHDAVFEIATYPSTLGIIIIVEDKTETEQLKRLSVIGQTAGMIGHDIRNPLQAMMSDVYLLKADLNSMPQCQTKQGVAESLAGIEQNIAYINKIVADLQDYSRPLKPEYATTDLNDVVASVFKTIVLPDDVLLSVDIKGFIKLETDPMFIRRMLTNLVNNAIQAMQNGGRLEVTGFEKQDSVFLTVSDTGMGIPEEVKPKLFTPMVTTKAKGQGLGLAVVKRLVECLNGSISFESQECKGTTFTLQLPKGKRQKKMS